MAQDQAINNLQNQVEQLSAQLIEQEKQIRKLTRAMSSARTVFGNKGTFF